MDAVIQNFFQKYTRILQERSHLAPNGQCRLWNHPPRIGRRYGEINVRFPYSEKYRKINVARLSLMIKLSTINLPAHLDSSHLCNQPTCINPLHLTLEEHGVNNNRISCFQLGVCSGLHEPPCMIHLRVCATYIYIYTSILCLFTYL